MNLFLFQSVVLGLVQGLAEFLPISSSAHLILVPWLLGWEDPGLTFDVALHLGTLVALLVYFRREWLQLVANTFRWLGSKDKNDPQLKLGPMVVAATVPGAILGFLLEKHAEETFRSPFLIAGTISIMGFLLWLADARSKKNGMMEQLGWRQVLLIGLAQGAALVPGVSRSGATISAGLALGLTRDNAARFSFLLAMPITAGACVLKLHKLHAADLTPSFMTGVAVAALSGYLAIDVLLKYVRTRSYGVFAAYRVVVGIGIVIAVATGFRHT